MRRGMRNGFLRTDDGKLMVVNMGADFTAEHEWGIKGIRQRLGMDERSTVAGIEKRRVRTLPDYLYLSKKHGALTMAPNYSESRDMEKHVAHLTSRQYGELFIYGDAELATAWDGDTFGVLSPKHFGLLEDLYDAFQRKDVAVWLGGGALFENAGLCLGIISRIPDDAKKRMEDADLDAMKLLEASRKTGIEERLKAAEKRYFALSPRWATAKDKTAHPVVYWLNPMEQSIHNWGWFTVEQLDEWAKNKGPVIKTAEERSRR